MLLSFKKIRSLYPGVLLSVIIGIAAIALAAQYGMPVMMIAVLLGLALSSLSTTENLEPGLKWSTTSLLYFGVALLGLRIDLAILLGSGWALPSMAIALVALTLLVGFFVSKWLVGDKHFAILIATAVAVCGVSAAAALCVALPKCDKRNSQLALTIGGITVLSTIAMIAYPFITHALNMPDDKAGLFLGGTIHNVSQAVGAGYSVNGATGDLATLIKLMRVALLLPVIVIVSWLFARQSPESNVGWKTYFPPFLIAFFILALLRYYGILPTHIAKVGSEVSEFFLIVSLVAIGMRTHLHEIINTGIKPVFALLFTTIFMAGLAILFLHFM